MTSAGEQRTYDLDVVATSDHRGNRIVIAFDAGPIVGQTMVEFAMILPVLLILMLGVIQLIVVGGSALAVNQAAITCARYASINPSSDQSTVNTYLKSIASPLINDAGLGTLSLTPPAVPRTTGTAVSVTINYSLGSKLFLGTSFFGVKFPTQVSITERMTSE
jgi:Flp pilus assembly protein TadG